VQGCVLSGSLLEDTAQDLRAITHHEFLRPEIDLARNS
jgi:hypothetical protein